MIYYYNVILNNGNWYLIRTDCDDECVFLKQVLGVNNVNIFEIVDSEPHTEFKKVAIVASSIAAIEFYKEG